MNTKWCEISVEVLNSSNGVIFNLFDSNGYISAMIEGTAESLLGLPDPVDCSAESCSKGSFCRV